MKRIIVTAAGRQRYLSILAKYLAYYHNLGEFDEWHLWENTEVQRNIEYIHELEKQYGFIKVIPFPDYETIRKTCFCNGPIYYQGKMVYAHTIKYFYGVDSTDEDALYLKLDDDIVFIKKESIKKIFEYRKQNTENFLVYGNTVNNAAMSYLHQQIGVLPETLGKATFNSVDPLALYSGPFSEFSHNNFFEKCKLGLLDQYNFGIYEIKDYVPVAIQVIAWWGKNYKKFGGLIPEGAHDEVFQAATRPQIEGKTNVILGDTLFCHYSAEVNRNYVDSTDVLLKYNDLVDIYLS